MEESRLRRAASCAARAAMVSRERYPLEISDPFKLGAGCMLDVVTVVVSFEGLIFISWRSLRSLNVSQYSTVSMKSLNFSNKCATRFRTFSRLTKSMSSRIAEFKRLYFSPLARNDRKIGSNKSDFTKYLL